MNIEQSCPDSSMKQKGIKSGRKNQRLDIVVEKSRN